MVDVILLAQDVAAEPPDWLNSIGSFTASSTGRIVCSAVLLVVALFLLLPPRGRGTQFTIAAWLTAVAMVILLLPSIASLPAVPAFFLLEGLAILGGLGTITSRNPVYSAIWFASALLAIGALLLMNGAQFLGVATVAVYAGAIVVTFLFLLMLAQPEGHAVYDRLSWGWFAALSATIAGVCLAAVVAVGVASAATAEPEVSELVLQVSSALDNLETTEEQAATKYLQSVQLTADMRGAPLLHVTLKPNSGLLASGEAVIATAIRKSAGATLSPATRILIRENDLLSEQHVARLGGELFSRQLIAVQVAGVLLLAALVGAIAMAIHGKQITPDARPRGGTA